MFTPVEAQCAVRSAVVEDAPAISSVHAASAEDAYAPLAGSFPVMDPDEHLEMWVDSLREHEGRPLILVATIGGTVVGFVTGGPARRTEPAAEVEVQVLHVHPAYRGRSIGTELWAAACLALRGPALASLYVNTLSELRCCSFYERHGGRAVAREPADFHGAMRTRVTYLWPSGAPSVR